MTSGTVRIIRAAAPIRICDLGGWTDTWFAGTGAVCNLAVRPEAEVEIRALSEPADRRHIFINAENYSERYTLSANPGAYDKHPLLEAALELMELPNLQLEINIFCAAPAGSSTGTSAAISVALLGALDLLVGGKQTSHEIASLAHRVETERLGLQCGIQDQLCSAYGGACFIEMDKYPHATVTRIPLPDPLRWEMERRLVLIYLGRAHSSSRVHEQVIRRLEEPGTDTAVLEKLRRAARAGKEALCAGNLLAYGRAMIDNTEAQAELHPDLVSPDARLICEAALAHGAVGWKVNGAGGDGGSLALLFGSEEARKRRFLRIVREMNSGFEPIPVSLAGTGLRRWEAAE